jgi:hypothetical protein
VLCAPSPDAVCDGGSCVPANKGPACVWIGVATNCTDVAPYVVQHDFVRSVSACACTDAEFNCGGMTAFFSNNDQCNGISPDILSHPQACYTFTSNATHYVFGPDDGVKFAGKCPTPPPTITDNAVTVCCMP